MTATIVDWLECDREPADLYELLGELRFEPSRQRLLAAVRAHYARLLPYENHADPNVARRATELLRRLAGADGTLRDLAQLRAHHREIMENLRAAAVQAGAARFSKAELAQWLEQWSVHPQRIPAVARMLAGPPEELQSMAMGATPRLDAPASKESREEFCLEELQPSHDSLHEVPALDAKGDAKESGHGDRVSPACQSAHCGRLSPAHAPPRQLPLLGWIALAGIGALCFLGILIAIFSGSEANVWQGVLLQVRGHAGEVHLLIQSERGSRVEAVTRDSRAARLLDEYWSVEELQELQSAEGGASGPEAGAGASRVAIRGRPVAAGAARFRLDSRPDVPLVELQSTEKLGGRRGVAGKSRAPARRAELAQFLRIHPPVGSTVSFPARYGGTSREGITVFPSASDQRPVPIEFPGTSPGDFANYRSGDSVVVQTVVSAGTSASRLALRGVEIRRLAEPASRVAAKGN